MYDSIIIEWGKRILYIPTMNDLDRALYEDEEIPTYVRHVSLLYAVSIGNIELAKSLVDDGVYLHDAEENCIVPATILISIMNDDIEMFNMLANYVSKPYYAAYIVEASKHNSTTILDYLCDKHVFDRRISPEFDIDTCMLSCLVDNYDHIKLVCKHGDKRMMTMNRRDNMKLYDMYYTMSLEARRVVSLMVHKIE